MESLTTTRRIGGSLVVTLPKKIVDEESIKEGEIIQIKVRKVKKDFFGALKGIGPFTKEDELDTEL